MTAPRCRVVIVTHDSDATLPACLESVLGQEAVELDVRIVDNGSRRDPAAWLRGKPGCTFLRNADNPGFSVACNQGAASTTTPWLLFLNPDCFLQPGQLAQLIGIAEAIPGLGVLGAQLLNADGSEQGASVRRLPSARHYLPWTPMPASRAEPLQGAGEEVVQVEAISGALMLMRSEAFVRIGGFDEAYRLHCEDLDLCRRLQAAGRVVACALGVRVTHLKGESSRRRPIWVEWQKHRGMWRYFSKFERPSTPVWLTAAVALGIALRFPAAALKAWWQARRSNSPKPSG